MIKQIHSIIPALAFVFTLSFMGEVLAVQASAKIPQKEMRTPFSLPAGVHLRSKGQEVPAAPKAPEKTLQREIKIPDLHSSPLRPPLKVKAILIGSHSRLALIDRHIVREGDSIEGEKILMIARDHVVLGQGGKKRTLFLQQSPVHLSVGAK